MNEDKLKVYLGNEKKTTKLSYKYQSGFVKPTGKFWKRLFNKQVRKGKPYKKTNWWYWS